ncbi:muscle-specific protein [Anaeramoeba flamelloides]|uniref:Muscle-specific protein n=1 Tax=Anaeramoeba flamelloides TaxID=1746091 RepID=A0ABQ8YE18_9EUKA|nr:muscle-specific protein [Anaeramoeba flamelloides]
MTEKAPIYGIDRELQRKQQAKFNPELEQQALNWIMDITGESGFEKTADLKNGVALCKLVNAIKPGSVRRINNSKFPFKMMENVNNFLLACEKLGVPKHDLFMTVDLYEEKNIPLVIGSIHSLGSAAQKVDGFEGPYIGLGYSKGKKMEFSEEVLKEGRKTVPLLVKKAGNTPNQSGMFDTSRNIVKSTEKGTGEIGLFESTVTKTTNQSGMFDTSRNIVKSTEKGTGEIGLFESSVTKTSNQSGMFDNSRNIIKSTEKGTGEIGYFESNVTKQPNQSGMFDNSRNIVKVQKEKK